MLRGDLLVINTAPGRRAGSGRPDWTPSATGAPLFSGLPRRHLKKVETLVRRREFLDGTTVVRKGSRGEAFFVILDGRATVEVPGGRPAPLREGDCFGELALIDGAPRAATVTADGHLTTGVISRRDFKQLLQDEPAVAVGLLPGLVHIIRELIKDRPRDAAASPARDTGSATEASYLLPGGRDLLQWKLALHQVPVFAPLPDRHLRRVAKLFTVKRHGNGSVLVREGAPGNSFALILEGAARGEASDGSTYDLGAGESFGELALIDGAPRALTITAQGDVTLATISRRDFQRLLRDEPALAVGLARSLVKMIRSLEA